MGWVLGQGGIFTVQLFRVHPGMLCPPPPTPPPYPCGVRPQNGGHALQNVAPSPPRPCFTGCVDPPVSPPARCSGPLCCTAVLEFCLQGVVSEYLGCLGFVCRAGVP